MGYNVTDIKGSVMQAGRKYKSRIVSILIDLNDFLHFELNLGDPGAPRSDSGILRSDPGAPRNDSGILRTDSIPQ